CLLTAKDSAIQRAGLRSGTAASERRARHGRSEAHRTGASSSGSIGRDARSAPSTQPAHLHNPAFSPDLKQLMARSSDADQRGVWVVDLDRGAPMRFVPYGT